MFSFFRRQKGEGDKRAGAGGGGKGDKDKGKDKSRDGKMTLKEKYTPGLSSPATQRGKGGGVSEAASVPSGGGVVEELPTHVSASASAVTQGVATLSEPVIEARPIHTGQEGLEGTGFPPSAIQPHVMPPRRVMRETEMPPRPAQTQHDPNPVPAAQLLYNNPNSSCTNGPSLTPSVQRVYKASTTCSPLVPVTQLVYTTPSAPSPYGPSPALAAQLISTTSSPSSSNTFSTNGPSPLPASQLAYQTSNTSSPLAPASQTVCNTPSATITSGPLAVPAVQNKTTTYTIKSRPLVPAAQLVTGPPCPVATPREVSLIESDPRVSAQVVEKKSNITILTPDSLVLQAAHAFTPDSPRTHIDLQVNKTNTVSSVSSTLQSAQEVKKLTLINPNSSALEADLEVKKLTATTPGSPALETSQEVKKLTAMTNGSPALEAAHEVKKLTAMTNGSPALEAAHEVKNLTAIDPDSLETAEEVKKLTAITYGSPTLEADLEVKKLTAMTHGSPALEPAQEVKKLTAMTHGSPALEADLEVKKLTAITSGSPTLEAVQEVLPTIVPYTPALQALQGGNNGQEVLATCARSEGTRQETLAVNSQPAVPLEVKPAVPLEEPRAATSNHTALSSGGRGVHAGDRTSDTRSLESQEKRYQEQLAELRAQIEAKDNEANKLCYRIEELQRDFVAKSGGMDRLQAELVAAHQESQCVRQKLRLLENDVAEYRQKNVDLAEELLRRSDEVDGTKDKDKATDNDEDEKEDDDDDEEDEEDDDNSEQIALLEGQVKELEEKMKEMKKEMDQLRVERDQLEEERAEMEAEREEEMKIVQDALEEVNEEKTLIRSEFETFRTVNTDREQKLLDDFEWKLREVEQSCKRRVEERERRATETIQGMESKIREAEERLNEIERLRACETEVVQLRGMTRDQQRSLRQATNKTEELQVSELILKEEVSRLRAALEKEKATVATLTMSNEKRLTELNRRCEARLESQRSEMSDQWQHRLRGECLRLKAELDQLHEEEKHLAVEAVKILKDQEVQAARIGWERRLQDTLKEVSMLKAGMAEKENHFHKEMERAQTNADRDILEMRRKLDKMDMTYQGQIEKLNENHEKEMEQLNWEVGRRISQLEQTHQLQNSSTRTTLELVKEQMERDAQSRLESAAYQHRLELEEQWERLAQDKEEEIQKLDENHKMQLQKLKAEFEVTMKSFSARENALVTQNICLEEQLKDASSQAELLASNASALQGSVQAMNQQMSQVQLQADNTLRVRTAELQAEKEAELADLMARHGSEQAQWQAQYEAMQGELSHKIDCLAKSVAEHEYHRSILDNIVKCDNEQQTSIPDDVVKCDNEQQTSILDDIIMCDNEQQTSIPDDIVKCDNEQQTSMLDDIIKCDNEQQTSIPDDIVKCDNKQQTSMLDDIIKCDNEQQTSIPDDIVKFDNEQQTSMLDDIIKCDNEQQTSIPDDKYDNEQQTSMLDDIIKCDNEQQTSMLDNIIKCDNEQQTSIPNDKYDNEQQTSMLDDIKCDNEQQTSMLEDIIKCDKEQQTPIPDDIVKCENEQQMRASRPEDLSLIAELRRALAERDRELASVTEEKTFYEQELLSHEASCNNTNIVSESYTGVLRPHKYTTHRPKKKGGGSRGGTTPPSQTEANVDPVTNILRSRSMEYPAIKVPSRSPTRKAKSHNASNGFTTL